MIVWFSGTGNSRYAARTIQSVTGDEIISINDMMKNGLEGPLRSEAPFVFVCPTYAGRIPRVVQDFIMRTKLEGSNQAYFVLTCSQYTGTASKYNRRLCESKGLEFLGMSSIVMPENYIAMYQPVNKEEADRIVQLCTPVVREAARTIKSGAFLNDNLPTPGFSAMSDLINPLFYAFVVKSKKFRATEGCTSCGQCVRLCPLNNISLKEGRPSWGKDCTHCMACIDRCPRCAIEYGKKTEGKNRYHLDDS
jgi:ferredoxin